MAVIVGAVVVVVCVIGAYFAYQKFAVHEMESDVMSYEIIDDSRLDVTVKVTREDPSREAVCLVRARSKDGSETGRREVLVPAGTDGTVLITAPVITSRDPGMGDLYGCSFDVPEYLTPLEAPR